MGHVQALVKPAVPAQRDESVTERRTVSQCVASKPGNVCVSLSCRIHDAKRVGTAGLIELERGERSWTGSYLAICFTASTIERVPMPK